MGCAISRKISTVSTSSQTSSGDRNRYSTSSSTPHYSITSPCYSMGATTTTNPPLALSQGSTWLVKPERAYSPVDTPAQRFEGEDRSFSGTLGGINSVFMSKKVSNSMSDIPFTDTTHNNTSSSSTTTATTSTSFSKQKKPKPKKSKNPSSSPQVPTESKLEISWPTSCHRNPGLLPSAIALGYPYPYPFPLSTVPSDPDLVATVEAAEEGVKTLQGENTGERQADGVYCGYYGYEYECLVEAGKEGARGGVRLEIRPGRNPKWEEKEDEAVDGVVKVGKSFERS